MRRTIGTLGAVLAAAALLAACGDDDDDSSQGGGDRQTVTVLAAASLTEVFNALEPVFEAAYPDADLQFGYGGSSDLSQQIVNGAPADVFASANEKQMKVVADADLVDGESQLFATNVLTIAVPTGNPAGIRGFADLADSSKLLVVCAAQVPCGAATEAVEKSTGVDLQPDSEESDVKSVLAKVAAGEADAGLVYVTDVQGAGVDSVAFPEAAGAVNKYPIAVISDGPQRDLGAAFVRFILSPESQRALQEAGFGAP